MRLGRDGPGLCDVHVGLEVYVPFRRREREEGVQLESIPVSQKSLKCRSLSEATRDGSRVQIDPLNLPEFP